MSCLTNSLRLARRMLISCLAIVTGLVTGGGTTARAQAPGAPKPNTLFIMGDDIGWMQLVSYQKGMGLGETPNLDRIGAPAS